MPTGVTATDSKKRDLHKIRAEDMEAKFRSKKAIYSYLTVQCKSALDYDLILIFR